MRATSIFLLFLFLSLSLNAQTMTGIVLDAASGAPMADVVVENIYTNEGLNTGADGKFSIAAANGQMVELHKLGYQKARVRIQAGGASFYRIFLKPGATELEEVEVHSPFSDWKHDSLRYHALFQKQINYPVLTGWRAIQSPFTALGRTNQQMIRFQKEYAWLEEIKYVDYAFNEKIVANLTGLRGDSAVAYMRQFRPSYEALRSMSDYSRFAYIKQTVALWRQRQRMGPSNGRGSGG